MYTWKDAGVAERSKAAGCSDSSEDRPSRKPVDPGFKSRPRLHITTQLVSPYHPGSYPGSFAG
ncbi:hypothetical protein PYJP_16080 [Pyrofollis japonicus]|nr:hypothetical protein PYJP_16080 [Pyrofollis japonicus]